LAARLIKDDDSVEKAVQKAWRLLKAANRLLKKQIPQEIRREQMQQELKRVDARKQFSAAVREITSQSRKDRALKYFKEFLKGSASKKGRTFNKALDDVKSYNDFETEGIDTQEIQKLKRLYQQAYPNRKRKNSALVESQSSMPYPRKIQIPVDDSMEGEV
jgi:hypothetical protein